MSEEAIQFGRALRVLRTTSGLSIRKVAQEVGFTAAHLGQIERGLVPPPDEVSPSPELPLVPEDAAVVLVPPSSETVVPPVPVPTVPPLSVPR